MLLLDITEYSEKPFVVNVEKIVSIRELSGPNEHWSETVSIISMVNSKEVLVHTSKDYILNRLENLNV